jgi:hypothetical protein
MRFLRALLTTKIPNRTMLERKGRLLLCDRYDPMMRFMVRIKRIDIDGLRKCASVKVLAYDIGCNLLRADLARVFL